MTANPRESSATLAVKYNDQGLVPAIVQDADTGQVLMMAWMNHDALQRTLDTGQATFYSRSRGKAWVKGETSGHIMQVIEARVDCDQDTILLRCKAHGPACHAGYHTYFYRAADGGDGLNFVEEKVFEPEKVYGG